MRQENEYLHRYNEFLDIYDGESDRGAAVIAGGFVESILGEMLEAVFVEGCDAKALLDGHGPLASFSSRIILGHALGLISDWLRRDLELIRKIRNHFAHHPGDASFSDGDVRNRCREFCLVKATPKEIADGLPAMGNPRSQFLFAVAVTAIHVEEVTKKIGTRQGLLRT